MLPLISFYLISAVALSVYPKFVCIYLYCSPGVHTFIRIFMSVFLGLILRLALFKALKKAIQQKLLSSLSSAYETSKAEILIEILIWLLIGLSIQFLTKNTLYPHLRYKLFLGCFAFSIFGGTLTYLLNMQYITNTMITSNTSYPNYASFKSSFSDRVAKLLLINIITIIIVIVCMLWLNITRIHLSNIQLSDKLYLGFFKELSYGIVIMVIMILIISKIFARHVKSVLQTQISAMESIVSGRLDLRIPILTDDELGLIASRTNEMIKGLREKDICQRRFGMYLTPEISELILKGGVNPSGQIMEATILFCDLRGYSQFAEKKSPVEVVQFLNQYFTNMEEIIRSNGGIVLQFIGDEIEAVFGAPKPLDEHADKALGCAISMRKRLMEMNKNRIENGEEPVYHGIGIHSGKVLAGSIGSPTRKSYAMVGDTVNLASRLQELNKEFGTDIIISRETKLLLKGTYPLKALGEVKIKGREQSVEIYAVL